MRKKMVTMSVFERKMFEMKVRSPPEARTLKRGTRNPELGTRNPESKSVCDAQKDVDVMRKKMVNMSVFELKMFEMKVYPPTRNPTSEP